MGAAGITLEWPMMRHANNLESVLTYEGTSEVHQLVLGKALTGQDAFADRAGTFGVYNRANRALICRRPSSRAAPRSRS